MAASSGTVVMRLAWPQPDGMLAMLLYPGMKQAVAWWVNESMGACENRLA